MTASANGTTIPSASSITDNGGGVWTVSSGTVLLNGSDAGFTEDVILLLWWNGTIYQENINDDWWSWTAGNWVSFPVDPRKTFYGVNLHPGLAIYQSLGTGPVVTFMQELGVTVGRMDCYAPTDNTIMATWCEALFNGGLVGLPILIAAPVPGDETTSYNNGYALGQAIATACAPYTAFYELSNEPDAYCGWTGDGLQPQCYPEDEWLAVRGTMRGAHDGVLSVQPNAVLVWAGQVELCEGFTNGMTTGVDPDGNTGGPIVSANTITWHWYQSSGNIENTGSSGTAAPCGSPTGGLNMLAFASSFGLPVWLTEIGNTAGDTQAQQKTYLDAAMAEYYAGASTYNLQNITWYELICVSEDGGTYGLVAENGTTKRSAFNALKTFITDNPSPL
jgi:hypothetical protein